MTPTSTRLARWAWLVVGSLVGGTLLLFSGVWVAAALARDSEDFAATYDGPIDALVVDVGDGGRVDVVGTSGDDVVVQGTEHRGLVAPERTSEQAGGTLELRADCGPIGPLAVAMFCRAEYVVEVPAELDVRIDGAGIAVSVAGVDGAVRVDVRGGHVELDDLSGPVEVDSWGDRVEATGLTSSSVDVVSRGGGTRLEFVEPPELVVVRTQGGGADVVLPRDDVAYAIDTTAADGVEIVDVRTDPDASRVVQLDSDGGGITVRYGDP